MKKTIDYYLLSGEVIDTRLYISDDYINYYDKYHKKFFKIMLIITVFSIGIFLYPYEYVLNGLLFIVFFIFTMGWFIFLYSINEYKKTKKYEYYITNKRIIFFDKNKRKIKALMFDEIEYIDIKKVKIDFNQDFDINNPKYKNKVVENIRFYNIDDVDFPYIVFWYLKDSSLFYNVINKYKQF